MADVSNPLNPVQMKNTVKTPVLLTLFFLLPFFLPAQLKLPQGNGLGADLRKVIADYPSRFINIMGEVKTRHEQATDYFCNFKINGAEEAIVTRYSSDREAVVSWEALLLTTDDFEQARKKFKTIFNQLNHLAVSLNKKVFHLRGNYEEPAEENKFTALLFVFDPKEEVIKKLKVELLLQYQAPMDWQVKLLVYDKEREDEESSELGDGRRELGDRGRLSP